MSQQGRGRGRDTEKTNKLTSKALQLLSTDIAKYRTSHSQQLQRRDVKNIQGHTTRNMTVTTTTQRQTAPLQYSQSPVSSSLHASSSSFSRAQSYEHMPSPSVQHRNISSRSSSSVAQSFVRNIPLTSKSSPQRKQTSSLSSSAAQSLARNILPLSKSPSQLKQTSSRSLSPAIKSFTQNIHPPSKPLSQYKQTLLRPSPSPSSSTVQRNLRLLPVRENSQEHKEEGTTDERTSHDIVRSLKMIMTQLRRMEERQISIEKKTDENTTAIKRLMRESAVKRPIKPQGISFKTVDDFLAFEEVDEEIYNDLVGYFIYLGRTNPVDCAAEYFRSIFPEDEEISSCLTLNGRTGPGGCKLRDSRFAQACQDAINANKYFPNPNNMEFYEALEKALKSLKTRKWRYNRKRRQVPLDEENEEVPPNRHRRIDNAEVDIELEDIQKEAEDARNGPEKTQHQDWHTEEIENAYEMDAQDMDGMENDIEDIKDIDTTEYADETEDNTDDDQTEKIAQNEDLQMPLREEENLMEDDIYGETGKIILFESPSDYC